MVPGCLSEPLTLIIQWFFSPSLQALFSGYRDKNEHGPVVVRCQVLGEELVVYLSHLIPQ